MPFNEKMLCKHLDLSDPASIFLVAYSGGLDSQVLLHALNQLKCQGSLSNRLEAVHINHGFSQNAEQWQKHCEEYCRVNEIPLHSIELKLPKQQAGSLETRAREARYAAFKKLVDEKTVLLMAHHQDDQLETFLFRLLRGAGPRGLKGIPAVRTFARGSILRPLLQNSREELLAYACLNELQWVEDESNLDISMDRNFLRHKVLPLLQTRWPGLASTWRRTISIMSETEALLQETGQQDLQQVCISDELVIDIDTLSKLSPLRQKNCLRIWLEKLHNEYQAPPADHRLLTTLLDNILPAAADAQPNLNWAAENYRQYSIRRYRNRLYALAQDCMETDNLAPVSLSWDLSSMQPLNLPDGSKLALHDLHDKLVRDTFKRLVVSYRQGGETVKLRGRPGRSLKKVLQDEGFAPWERTRVPLIHHDEKLIAIGDTLVCENCPEILAGKMPLFVWNRRDIRCG